MNPSGFLLVIEGIDGAGKSTLQRRLGRLVPVRRVEP
jgi:thymidylate kinase